MNLQHILNFSPAYFVYIAPTNLCMPLDAVSIYTIRDTFVYYVCGSDNMIASFKHRDKWRVRQKSFDFCVALLGSVLRKALQIEQLKLVYWINMHIRWMKCFTDLIMNRRGELRSIKMKYMSL